MAEQMGPSNNWLIIKDIPPDTAKRLRIRLDALDAASNVSEMDVPGWDLHELKGDRKGTWSVKVTANYRLTFRFTAGEALDVDSRSHRVCLSYFRVLIPRHGLPVPQTCSMPPAR